MLFWQGFTALSPTLFTEMTPPPDGGRLANAIYGSVVIVFVATFISTPIGILPASTSPNRQGRLDRQGDSLHQRHHCRRHRSDWAVRLHDYVAEVNHFSGWAARRSL